MEGLESRLKILQDKRTLKSTSEYKEFEYRVDRIKLGLYTLMPKDSAKVRALVAYKLVLDGGGYDEHTLLRRVSKYSGVAMKNIKYGGKKADLAALRHVNYHAYRCLGLSFPKIGKIVGGKDHATVINGCNVVNEDIAKYKEFVDLAFMDRRPSGEEMHKALRYDKE